MWRMAYLWRTASFNQFIYEPSDFDHPNLRTFCEYIVVKCLNVCPMSAAAVKPPPALEWVINFPCQVIRVHKQLNVLDLKEVCIIKAHL